MRNVARALTLLSAILLAASPALGQNRADTFEASIHVGWSFFDSESIEDRYLYGARFGWNFTRHIQVEGYFDQVDRTEDETGLGLEFDVNSYGIDFVWNWGGRRRTHVPYLLAGIGRAETAGDIDEDWNYVEAGGGWRFFVNEILGFRLDARALGSDEEVDIGADMVDVKATVGLSFVLEP